MPFDLLPDAFQVGFTIGVRQAIKNLAERGQADNSVDLTEIYVVSKKNFLDHFCQNYGSIRFTDSERESDSPNLSLELVSFWLGRGV